MSKLDEYYPVSPGAYKYLLEMGGEEQEDENGTTYLTHPNAPGKYIKSEPFETRDVDNS